jgi:hypothetical protein
VPTADPVPVTGWKSNPGPAVVTVNVVERAPTADGVNPTLTVHDCPGANTRNPAQSPSPNTNSAGADDTTPVTCTDDKPVFVTATALGAAGVATVTAPKSTDPTVTSGGRSRA